MGALQHGDDRGQARDALVGRGVDELEFGDFGFQRQTLLIGRRLLGMGSSNHRLEGVDVIGKLPRIGRIHACKMAQNTPDCFSFCASESVCRRLLPSRLRDGFRHRVHPFPVHAIDQGQQLGMA